MHMRTPPHDPMELAELPANLRDEIDNWTGTGDKPASPRFDLSSVMNGGNIPCLWLDLTTGQCKNYEHRPAVCRDFDVGCISCRMLRKEVGLTVKGMPIPNED